ncbi:MAG: hypothetical protein HYZ28_22400 [Myxococcales bacterium]|nr:hypothetical protein [Myxococcales bacterium]
MATGAPPSRKVAVLPLEAGKDVDAKLAEALTEAFVTAYSRGTSASVISSGDMLAVIGLERQRALLGCADQDSGCLAELGGALGADFLVSGAISRVGRSFILTARVYELARSAVVGRAEQRVDSEDGLLDASGRLAADLTTGADTPVRGGAGRRLFGFGLLGISGLLAAGGVWAGLSAQQQMSIAARPETPQPSVPQMSSAARTTGLIGDGLYVGAAAAAFGAAWILLVQGDGKGVAVATAAGSGVMVLGTGSF